MIWRNWYKLWPRHESWVEKWMLPHGWRITVHTFQFGPFYWRWSKSERVIEAGERDDD